MADPSSPSIRIVQGLHWFLLASCLFLIPYDLLVERIWWTSVSIYLPCIGLFGASLGAIRTQRQSWLAALGYVNGLLTLALLGYGGWLCGTGEWLWGPVTLGFAALIGWLTWQLKAFSKNPK
ncbi:MAG: hypothetical protein AAF399_27630 [Bacteroidota bacterium]